MNGYVYVVQYLGTDFYKIGLTERDSPEQRLNTLRTYAPKGLKVILLLETAYPRKLEKELHEDFKHKRLEREFFQLNEDDLKLIKDKYSVTESKLVYVLQKLRKYFDNDELLYSVLKQQQEKIGQAKKYNPIHSEETWDTISALWYDKYKDEPVTCTEILELIQANPDKIKIHTNTARGLGTYLRKRWERKPLRRNGSTIYVYYNDLRK